MNFETLLLARLKTAQQEFALEALRRPQNRDAFEYGYRVGLVEGYEAAINVLINLISEDKYGERDL
tara:strand:- start:135 stop:332 length:198 start_codon:yes stop_codon:yes gene_type:complete